MLALKTLSVKFKFVDFKILLDRKGSIRTNYAVISPTDGNKIFNQLGSKNTGDNKTDSYFR